MLARLCLLSTLRALCSLARRAGLSYSISLGAFLGENSDTLSSWTARAGAKRADLRSRGETRVGDVFDDERRRLRDRGIFSGEIWPSGLSGTLDTVWTVCMGLIFSLIFFIGVTGPGAGRFSFSFSLSSSHWSWTGAGVGAGLLAC